MSRKPNYDKDPVIGMSSSSEACASGWEEIAARIRPRLPEHRAVVCVECYPGVYVEEFERRLADEWRPRKILCAEDHYKSEAALRPMLAPLLTSDPVFGRMNDLEIADFFAPERLAEAKRVSSSWTEGLLLVIGCGASLIEPHPDVLVYADMARWEIQQRQRRHRIGNLGCANHRSRASALYKQAFFVDWRAADRLKRRLFPSIDYLLDTNDPREAKLLGGDDFRAALQQTVRRPFRVRPFFDPGPWGGEWMRRVCELGGDEPNFAWCFDCVPEENSLLLGYGSRRVEAPAIDLVFSHPIELLGQHVFKRFGAEFPIRFDFLDTIEGGNLSLQVHPREDYIRDRFGISYTQDESYYLLDAGDDATVYLGVKDGADTRSLARDLEAAQNGGPPFPAERYVNRFPARKHDHFLIPAGTIHCSGRNAMVLEISATPYIFTFKLWDWGRLGLDGRPRPIHLEDGINNIQWDRDTNWVTNNLVNRVTPLAAGDGWSEERTGLHELEFIETRRHWFTATVPHNTDGGVNVLNLVEGEEAILESPAGAFEPLVVHYAETFIVPAALGEYTIRPHGLSRGERCATIKASVRKTL